MKDFELDVLTPEEGEKAKAFANDISEMFEGAGAPVIVATLAALVVLGIGQGMWDTIAFQSTLTLYEEAHAEMKEEKEAK